MLARVFKTAEELDIPERFREALIKLLDKTELGEVEWVHPAYLGRGLKALEQGKQLFNMSIWSQDHVFEQYGYCGTIGCIGGSAEIAGGLPPGEMREWLEVPMLPTPYFPYLNNGAERLRSLFYPYLMFTSYMDITLEQAEQALRNYLTTGDAKWGEVVDDAAAGMVEPFPVCSINEID